MQILGAAAIVAALAGFGLFFSTVNAAYGVSGVALILGLGALLIMIPVTWARARAAIAPGDRANATMFSGGSPDVSLGTSHGTSGHAPAARGWTLGVIFAMLLLGVFTLRYMYWL